MRGLMSSETQMAKEPVLHVLEVCSYWSVPVPRGPRIVHGSPNGALQVLFHAATSRGIGGQCSRRGTQLL